MKKIFFGGVLFFALVFGVVRVIFFGHNNQTHLPEMQCLSSFEEFAYFSTKNQPIPYFSESSWEVESQLPEGWLEYPKLNRLYGGVQATFSREVNGVSEIWLVYRMNSTAIDEKTIFVYTPASKNWVSISNIVKDTKDVFIEAIFLAQDGSIWGINNWYSVPVPNEGPLLSKFNEQLQEFELVEGSPEILHTKERDYRNIKVLTEGKNIFWILVSKDGIYRYDSSTQNSTKEVSLDTITNILDAVLSATENTIYIETLDYGKADAPVGSIYEGFLLQFNLVTKELKPLGVPKELWPRAGFLFVTQANELWVGAVGYNDLKNREWHLLHPDPNYFFQLDWLVAHSPSIMLESSDGLLWFNTATDFFTGTAWYDPQTKSGCMFTHVATNVIEDSERQLWFFAEGKLYKYER